MKTFHSESYYGHKDEEEDWQTLRSKSTLESRTFTPRPRSSTAFFHSFPEIVQEEAESPTTTNLASTLFVKPRKRKGRQRRPIKRKRLLKSNEGQIDEKDKPRPSVPNNKPFGDPIGNKNDLYVPRNIQHYERECNDLFERNTELQSQL